MFQDSPSLQLHSPLYLTLLGKVVGSSKPTKRYLTQGSEYFRDILSILANKYQCLESLFSLVPFGCSKVCGGETGTPIA